MDDFFLIYETNFNSNLKKIKLTTDFLSNSNNNTNPTSSNQDISLNDSSLSETNSLITENEKIIKLMKAQCSSLTNKATYNTYNTIISQCTDSLSSCKKIIRQYEDNVHLTKARNCFLIDTKPNEKGSLIENEQAAFSGSQKLEEAKRVLAGTEDVGMKIMNEMDIQSEQMKGVNVKISGMNNQLDGSNELLQSMQGKFNENKKLFLILGAVLIGLLVIILTIKLLF